MTDNIATAILCGGHGRRLGGDKTRIRIDGRPVLEHLLARIKPAGPLFVVARAGQGVVAPCPVIDDAGPGDGPLRGIFTALSHARHLGARRVAIYTVDMPLVWPGTLDLLLHPSVNNPDMAGVMWRRQNLIEPFPCLLGTSLSNVICARLLAGKLAVHALVSDGVVCAFEAPADLDPLGWTNLNTPDDLRQGGLTISFAPDPPESL